MIVYGDPQFSTTVTAALDQLELRPAATTLDEARAHLIEAGEFEQAVADAFDDPDLISAAQDLTDELARNFVAARGGDAIAPVTPTALARVRNLVPPGANPEMTVKVPEGFAFYSLYPEQYVEAARQWSAQYKHGADHAVCVIGLRSIGTALSAVVRETLRADGWRTHRLTVRPAGHPFDRRVELRRDDLRGARLAIVVDEGPGLSGSSMAAVARALYDVGIRADAVSFFPAHDQEPGSAASPAVRDVWRRTRRYTSAVASLRWNGRSLQETLARETTRLTNAAPRDIHDLSGGLWRRFAYPDESMWPAANIAFERAKFLVATESNTRVLWKFIGLRQGASDRELRCLGFSPTTWIDGARLDRADLDDTVLDAIANAIQRSAGTVIGGHEAAAAFERIANMLRWNAAEILGAEAATCVSDLVASVADHCRNLVAPRYGDGRLAPHEFVRAHDGSLIKTDVGGHDCDHTVIGTQPMLWDIAGAIVEWALDGSRSAALCERLGLAITEPSLRFYRAAYSAFRAGMFWISPGDEFEKTRSAAAIDFYRAALQRAISR